MFRHNIGICANMAKEPPSQKVIISTQRHTIMSLRVLQYVPVMAALTDFENKENMQVKKKSAFGRLSLAFCMVSIAAACATADGPTLADSVGSLCNRIFVNLAGALMHAC
jgi:hypothetical protein